MSGPAFAGAGLDRAGERRADIAWVAERRADPASRAVVMARDGVAVTGAGDFVSGARTWSEAQGGSADARLARVPLTDVAVAGGARDAVLLGLEPGGAALFGVALPAAPEGTQSVNLRRCWTRPASSARARVAGPSTTRARTRS